MTYRRELFESVGGYRAECEFWEDHDLILRMAAASKVMVVPKAIYGVRQSTTSTRIVSAQERLERAEDLMYRSSDRLERNQSYDDLLNSKRPFDAKLDPRVFIALGSMVLWSGGKPRLFRRLLSRAELSLNVRTITALVWTAWASSSPGSLRIFLRVLFITRNIRAGGRLNSDEPVVWIPGRGATQRPTDTSRP